MMRAVWIIAALLGLVAVGAYARATVAPVDNSAPEEASSVPDLATDPGGWTDAAAATADASNPFALMDQSAILASRADDNCDAFLQMISHAEGTDRDGLDPYAICYGYRHTIGNFADHPAVTGEWRGEPLDQLGPSYVGKVSTAAGRYQIIRPTWQGCKRALALTDFGPESQDAAALYLVRESGALEDVKAGRFELAVSKCARQWASLPGANAPGQAMRRLDDLRAAFVNAGGTLA